MGVMVNYIGIDIHHHTCCGRLFGNLIFILMGVMVNYLKIDFHRHVCVCDGNLHGSSSS